MVGLSKVSLRAHARRAALACALGLVLATEARAAPDTPEAAVARFYTVLREERVTGLPDARQLSRLNELLSARLKSLLEAARLEQARYAREHPGEKPPYIEGDLFSSLFEGPTAFAVTSVRADAGRARVVINFEYREAPPREGYSKWRDAVLLVRERGRWRVDDVEYRGDWPFATRGSLARNLEATAR